MTIAQNALPRPLYAGTAVTVGVTFSNPVAGEPPSEWPAVDPNTITLTFIAGTGASPVTWTYGSVGSIVRVNEGTYTAELVTDGTKGPWSVKWIGTGACAAVWIAGFEVTPQPF